MLPSLSATSAAAPSRQCYQRPIAFWSTTLKSLLPGVVRWLSRLLTPLPPHSSPNYLRITNPERELTWAQFLDLIPDLAGGKPVGKKAASDPGQPQTAVLEETPKPALSTPTAVRGPADLVTPVPMQEAIRLVGSLRVIRDTYKSSSRRFHRPTDPCDCPSAMPGPIPLLRRIRASAKCCL